MSITLTPATTTAAIVVVTCARIATLVLEHDRPLARVTPTPTHTATPPVHVFVCSRHHACLVLPCILGLPHHAGEMYIPSELGYGDRGAGADIGQGDVLVFTMEIVEINGPTTPAEAASDL